MIVVAVVGGIVNSDGDGEMMIVTCGLICVMVLWWCDNRCYHSKYHPFGGWGVSVSELEQIRYFVPNKPRSRYPNI